MNKLYVLMVIIPICFCIKYPWEWDIIDYIKDKIDDIKDKLSTNIPSFIKDIEDKLEDFKKYADEKKTEIIEKTQYTIEELYLRIKIGHEAHIKPLIEKATELAKYLPYKICDGLNIDYEDCRNDKKKIFSKLLDILRDELQCSKIISLITTYELSDDLEENLKYILFLIQSLIKSPDAIEFGKSIIIYDAMNCLQEKFEEYFPIVVEKITGKPLDYKISLKLDIIELLIDSISNIVKIIHFEEIDGFIQNEKPGLISNENAKTIQKNIFETSKKLFEFGTQLYNINNQFSVNIIMNPINLKANSEFQIVDYKEKGVKIALHSNYIFKITGAYYIQTIVFDSPLISVKSNNSTGGSYSNCVGITLYDKNGNEIKIYDININRSSPVIYFNKKIYNDMNTCSFYNEKEDIIEIDGIETQTEFLDGEEYMKCFPKSLTSFTIGSLKEYKLRENNGSFIHISLFSMLLYYLLL